MEVEETVKGENKKERKKQPLSAMMVGGHASKLRGCFLIKER